MPESPATPATIAPLSAAEKSQLVLRLMLLTALLYVASGFMVAVVVLMLALDAAILVLLATAHVGSVMHRPIRRLAALLHAIATSLWVGAAPETAVTLAASEAPEIFHMARSCAGKIGCAPPHRIEAVAGANAYVDLQGSRGQPESCVLGVGMMLAAVADRQMLECILLHEMAHARLVDRGLSGRALRAQPSAVVHQPHQLEHTWRDCAPNPLPATNNIRHHLPSVP